MNSEPKYKVGENFIEYVEMTERKIVFHLAEILEVVEKDGEYMYRIKIGSIKDPKILLVKENSLRKNPVEF